MGMKECTLQGVDIRRAAQKARSALRVQFNAPHGAEEKAGINERDVCRNRRELLSRAAVPRELGRAHIHLGDSIYANFNFTAVDDSHIYIGSHTMIGPNVTVATAGHPILSELREKAYQFNMPVRIGENCWIGAGGSDNARRDDRGQQRYRRGQRRYERYSGECRRLRQSLPRREGDKRARPRVLLQRQTNHKRDF